MNKNNILRFAVLAALPTTLLTACQFEDDDYFEESASLRVEHTIANVKDILAKPSNGWVMQYFVGTGVAHFEGFNLFAKFDKSMKVTMAGDHRMLRNGNAGKYTESSSIYSLLLEDGPVLAFNTWNDILTPFVDPVSPWSAPNTLVKDGAGMEGDNNFVIVSYKDNEVILRGERHSAEVRLIPCEGTWKDYIQACTDMKEKVTNGSVLSYYITDDKDTLFLTGLAKGRVRMSERLENPLRRDSLSSLFTPTGLRFEKEDTVGTHVFHEFTLNNEKTYLKNEDGTVKIIPCWDTYVVNHSGVWKFDKNSLSAEQTDLFTKIDAELKAYNSNYELESLGVGLSQSINGLVVTFYSNAAKTRTNSCVLGMTINRIAYGQISQTVTTPEKCDKNMASISKKATNLKSYCAQFIGTISGSFKLVPDDYFLPTGATYTTLDGAKSFVLKK